MKGHVSLQHVSLKANLDYLLLHVFCLNKFMSVSSISKSFSSQGQTNLDASAAGEAAKENPARDPRSLALFCGTCGHFPGDKCFILVFILYQII